MTASAPASSAAGTSTASPPKASGGVLSTLSRFRWLVFSALMMAMVSTWCVPNRSPSMRPHPVINFGSAAPTFPWEIGAESVLPLFIYKGEGGDVSWWFCNASRVMGPHGPVMLTARHCMQDISGGWDIDVSSIPWGSLQYITTTKEEAKQEAQRSPPLAPGETDFLGVEPLFLQLYKNSLLQLSNISDEELIGRRVYLVGWMNTAIPIRIWGYVKTFILKGKRKLAIFIDKDSVRQLMLQSQRYTVSDLMKGLSGAPVLLADTSEIVGVVVSVTTSLVELYSNHKRIAPSTGIALLFEPQQNLHRQIQTTF